MSTYRAPLADMQFVLHDLAGLEQVATLPGFEEAIAGRRLRDPGRGVQVRHGGARSAQSLRRPRRREASGGRDGPDAARVQGGLPAVLRERLERTHQEPGVRGTGTATARGDRGRGDVALVEHGLRPVSAAHAGRDRGARTGGQRGSAAALPAEDGLGRVDGHDEPDRAAGRLRPRRGAHACREAAATGRTSSPATRSSSPTASTTTPRTSSTWCSRARPRRPRA